MKYFSKINPLFKLCIALTIAACLSSCEVNDDAPPFQEVEYEKFAGLMFEKEVDLKDCVQEYMRQNGINSLEDLSQKTGLDYKDFNSKLKKLKLYMKLAPKYNIHGIKYYTTDPNGNAVIASGVLYYPKKIRPKGVVLISPCPKTKGKCGTDVQMAYEAISCLTGYVCIVPDGIGLGNTAKLPIVFVQHENIAQISVDMQQASREFIHNRYHYDIPDDTYLYGYSLGASGIWAVARYYQQHPGVGFRAKEIFIGGGAYYPELMLENTLETCHSSFAVLPCIIWSTNHYNNLGLDFSKVFRGKLLEGMPELCNGERTIAEVTSYLGEDIREYFDEDFISNRENLQYLTVSDAFKRNSIPNDWTPQCMVHLYHSVNDEIAPPICSDRLYEYLKSVNAKVNYKKGDQPHTITGINMEIDFFYFLLDR